MSVRIHMIDRDGNEETQYMRVDSFAEMATIVQLLKEDGCQVIATEIAE